MPFWGFVFLETERPCTRCVKRNIGNLCHDEPRDMKRIKTEQEHSNDEASPNSKDFSTSPIQEMATNTAESQEHNTESSSVPTVSASMPPPRSLAGNSIVAPSPVSAAQQANLNSNSQACRLPLLPTLLQETPAYTC